MKQGRATTYGNDSKVEPKSRAVNPGAVDQLGQALGPPRAITPMDAGRGYKAPAIASSTHKCGTQGKH